MNKQMKQVILATAATATPGILSSDAYPRRYADYHPKYGCGHPRLDGTAPRL